ncbi:response regulator receiver protein [Rhizobium sp. Pop5]|nr:response regulator receiver protein [Rhizobium sp. Pop5]
MNVTMKDIFIVEDDTLIAMLLEDMLGDLGYRVCASAPDLERALATAKDSEFDAAILDVSLAGHSSLPVAKLLDERGKPYLYATGYGSAPEGSTGTQSVLRKPFQLSELEQAMKRLTQA